MRSQAGRWPRDWGLAIWTPSSSAKSALPPASSLLCNSTEATVGVLSRRYTFWSECFTYLCRVAGTLWSLPGLAGPGEEYSVRFESSSLEDAPASRDTLSSWFSLPTPPCLENHSAYNPPTYETPLYMPLPLPKPSLLGFPGGSGGKEPACDTGDPGSISGPGRSAVEGNGYPLQYSCLENSTDRGACRATYSPWGRKESDTTEQLTLRLHFSAQNAPLCQGIMPASLCH